MGYRSDVRIVVTKKGYDELNKYINEYIDKKENLDSDYNLLNHTDVKFENNNSIYLGWNNEKWYEYSKYEDINAIMEGIEHLKDNDFSYRYARIGESIDDIEARHYESNIESEQDIEYPMFRRDFDDEYTITQMINIDKIYDENNESEKKELKLKLLGYDDFDYGVYIDGNGRYYKDICFDENRYEMHYGSCNDFDCEPVSLVPEEIKIIVVKDFENGKKEELCQ